MTFLKAESLTGLTLFSRGGGDASTHITFREGVFYVRKVFLDPLSPRFYGDSFRSVVYPTSIEKEEFGLSNKYRRIFFDIVELYFSIVLHYTGTFRPFLRQKVL